MNRKMQRSERVGRTVAAVMIAGIVAAPAVQAAAGQKYRAQPLCVKGPR